MPMPLSDTIGRSALEATLALLVKDVIKRRSGVSKLLRRLVRLCKRKPNLAVHVVDELLEKYSKYDAKKHVGSVCLTLVQALINHCPTELAEIASAVLDKHFLSNGWLLPTVEEALWGLNRPKEVSKLTRKLISLWSQHEGMESVAKGTLEILIRGCKCPDEIADVLLQRQHACSISIQTYLQSQLVQLASLCSNKAENIYEALLDACGANNFELRHGAVSQLVAMMKIFPHHAAEVAKTLTDACSDRDSKVKVLALFQIADAIKEYPDHSEEFCLQLEKASESSLKPVFFTALALLPKVAKVCPWESPDLYDRFILSFLHVNKTLEHLDSGYAIIKGDYKMKDIPKVEWLKDAFVAWPEDASELVNLLLQSLARDPFKLVLYDEYDEPGFTIRKALETIPTALEAFPGKSRRLIDALLKAAEHHQLVKCRELALGQFASCLKLEACEGLAPRFIEVLLEACRIRSYEVRRAAVGQLAEIAKVDPKLVKESWVVSRSCLHEWNKRDRTATVASTATLVEAFPENSAEFIEALIRGCENSDDNVREDAIRQLLPTAKLVPERAERLIVDLFNSCRDGALNVRRAAASHLGEVAKAFPSMKEDILRALDECLYNRHGVVPIAVEQITPILRALPKLAIKAMAKVERKRIKVKALQNEAMTKEECKKIIKNLVKSPVSEDINVFSGQKRRRSNSSCSEKGSPRAKRKHGGGGACALRRTCSDGGSPPPDDWFY